MIIFIILVLISFAIFFALLEQKNGWQEKDRQGNDWNEQERQRIERQRIEQQQKEVREADQYYERQQKERQQVEQYRQREKEQTQKITNALVVERYDNYLGIIKNLIPLEIDSTCSQCISVEYRVDSYSKKEIISIGIIGRDRYGDCTLHTSSMRVPANNEYYALKNISKIVCRYHVDIGKKIVYLDKVIGIIEELERFVSSSEYIQPNRMFPKNSSEIYNLNSEYKGLHQKYNLLIFNVMKGDKLIGYTAENFPDISVSVATLDREHNELTERFILIKQELDTYSKLKIDLKSLGYYERRYEY